MKSAVRLIEAEAIPDLLPIGNTPTVERYLRQLGLAYLEAADDPKVRPLLFALLLLAPRTLCDWVGEGKQLPQEPQFNDRVQAARAVMARPQPQPSALCIGPPLQPQPCTIRDVP